MASTPPRVRQATAQSSFCSVGEVKFRRAQVAGPTAQLRKSAQNCRVRVYQTSQPNLRTLTHPRHPDVNFTHAHPSLRRRPEPSIAQTAAKAPSIGHGSLEPSPTHTRQLHGAESITLSCPQPRKAPPSGSAIPEAPPHPTVRRHTCHLTEEESHAAPDNPSHPLTLSVQSGNPSPDPSACTN